VADLSAPITQRLVTFEQIGRFRDIDALLLAGDDFDDHAATVYRHARRYLGSKELDLSVEDQEALRSGEMNLGDAVRRGRVAAGRVRPAGVTGSPHLGVAGTTERYGVWGGVWKG